MAKLGIIVRYRVAPRIDALLCDRCELAPVEERALGPELASALDEVYQRARGGEDDCALVLSHEQYCAIVPHPWV